MVASMGWTDSAIAQTWDPIIIHPDGSRSTPSPNSDSNADAWPDDPFATLTDGDLWYAAAPARTVAALRWQSGSGVPPLSGDIETLYLEVTRSDNTIQRIRVQAPGTLAAPGETAVLLVGVASDLDSLFGADQAAAIAPPEGFGLLPGAQYIEISVLISPDNGATFDELDPARLQDAPIRLRIENLTANVDSIPVLYEHPTYIASDPHTGLTPLAEPGAWTPAPSMTLPYTERDPNETAEPVYLDADLRSLSVFAPMTEAETTPTGPDTAVNEPDPNDTSTDLLPVVLDPSDTTNVTPLDGTETTPLDSDSEILPMNPDGGGTQISTLLAPGDPIWADFGYTGTELGTEKSPFNTLGEAVYVAVANGSSTIKIDRVTPNFGSGETPTISAPMTIEAVNGLVRIGQATRVLYASFTQWGAVTFDPVGSPMEGDLPYAINPEYRVYGDGDVVTLNAYPADGLRFKGWWSPNADFNEPVTPADLLPSTHHRIAMNRDRYVWAIFEPNTENYDLTDSDADGLTAFREAEFGTSDSDADSDDDGLPDGWEANYDLDPLSAAGNDGPAGDPDGDTVTNLDEFIVGTSPRFDESAPPPAPEPPPTGAAPANLDDLNPDFNFISFSSPQGLSLQNDAAVVGADIRVVDAGDFRSGAVWTANKMPIAKGFTTTFTFNLLDGHSDGISFVIQNSSAAPPLTTGHLMGYTGIPNSLAVELDTYRNALNSDPAFEHLSVHTRGASDPNDADELYSIASASAGSGLTLGNHTMGVAYDAPTSALFVSIDGVLTLGVIVNLETTLNLDDGKAYIGIMSTTGVPAATDGPTMLYSWSADFITSPAAADLRLLRVSANRTDTGSPIFELEAIGQQQVEDFGGGFTEWGQPDAYPFQLQQQANANPTRGEYPRSFDVYFDQVARPVPNENLATSFSVNLEAFIEGGFPESTYNMVWSFEQGSTNAGRIVNFGHMAALEFDDTDPPTAGLYKIRCEARMPGESAAPVSRTAVAYILLPYAGPEITDWLIEEARQIARVGGVGDQWVSHVDDEATIFSIPFPIFGPIDIDGPRFRQRAFTSVSWNMFDYADQMTFGGVLYPPTPRFNFADSQRRLDDPLKDNYPFNDPSYATLQGLVVARQKITNVLWAVWGRTVGYSELELLLGSNANNMQKLKFEDKSSNNGVRLGSSLCDAIRLDKSNAEILQEVLTRANGRGIQTDGSLNDVRLWPRPDATAPPHTAFWSYDEQQDENLNLDDLVTWVRPKIFVNAAEMDLNPYTTP
jgi:hypothetical protein